MKKIIHVDQATIRRNRKLLTNDPPLIVRDYKGSSRAQEVDILDKDGNVVATFKHSPHKPLACGARVWFETKFDIVIR